MSTIVTLYNLSVKLETRDMKLISLINSFIDSYYKIEAQAFSKSLPSEIKYFAGVVKNRGLFFFNTNQFIHLLDYFKEQSYVFQFDEKIDCREYPIVPADFKLREQFILREDQESIVQFLLDNQSKTKLVPAQTGSGKSVMALAAISRLKQRMGIVILPNFTEEWIKNFIKYYGLQSTDVMVIQGSKSVRGVIMMAREGTLIQNCVIFSNRTLQDYIDCYEEDPEYCIDFYGAEPIEFFTLLGIGVLLNDESHMQYYSVYKILLYANVKLLIGLSATLLSEDAVVKRAHTVVYPPRAVYQIEGYNRYADVYAIAYGILPDTMKHIRTTNYGSTNYSHIAFEQSILKRSFIYPKYVRLIVEIIDDYYVAEHQERDKLLIFVSTIKFATQLTEYLKEHYPKYITNRYCEDDPYENITSADIIVSTIISAGTAIDIPGLRVVIQTVSISSPVANLQTLGRLRKLVDRDVKFCYLFCPSIPKQRQYHRKRMDLFTPRAQHLLDRRARNGL